MELMGFLSINDYLNKNTTTANLFRYDWQKQTPANTLTAGRWYDTNVWQGYPNTLVYGDMTVNGIIANNCYLAGGGNSWVLGSGWTFTPVPNGVNTLAYSGSVSTSTVAQNSTPTLINGHTYLVNWTLTWTSGTSITASLGNQNGSARNSSGTYQELLTVTGSFTTPLTFTPTTDAVCAISNVSVVDTLQSVALSDTQLSGNMQTGGPVGSKTKHISHAGVVSNAANMVPGVWMLCDMLMAYPGINQNSSSQQALTTTATLPRYTNGVGVRAFMIPQYVGCGGSGQSIYINYTNSASTAYRGLPVVTTVTINAMPGFVYHSGVAINNWGPFLPLAPGDNGITSVQSVTLSAAGGTAGVYLTLVLCKPLAVIPNPVVNVMTEVDFLNQFGSLPRVYDGACLGLLYMAGAGATAGNTANGYFDFVNG